MGEFVIEGLSNETDEELRRHLRIEPGKHLTIHEPARIEREPIASGRFYSTKAEVIAPPFGDGPGLLRIIVQEGPYLSRPGTESWEQTLPSLLQDLDPELRQRPVEAELFRLSGRGPATED